ncbi:hypothetical protein BDZ94DRAFT_1266931 [Collybia nuda]|uniref:Secreted protein n=1 Tax=Collybia nuda TaxID=64659 RepID=A0A9P5Y2G8_9AGAR|nr:hypothetical protein BDZ94DRAFT_1266931 [Collybia nuda]
MKSSMFFAAVASLMPTLAMGLVGISWNVTGVPSSGLRNITFPFNIAQTPHRSGYYFAQQFNFVGQRDVGYAGLQPRPDSNGQPIIHGVFSSFIAGTTTSDPNCHTGADGGPGVSCSVDFPGRYADTWNVEISNVVGTTWRGDLFNTVTGSRVHIGTYTLPPGTQGIAGNQLGFVEYYPWNSGTHTCNSLPYSSVTFGVPRSSVGRGSLSDAFEYGDCVGKVGYRSSRDALGVRVQVGF